MMNIMPSFKKILITFLLFAFLSFSVLTPHVKAQTWYNQGFFDWWLKVYDAPSDEIFGERYTAAQVQWVLWGLVSQPLAWMANGNEEGIMCLVKAFANNTIDISDCYDGVKNAIQNKIDFAFPDIQAYAGKSTLAKIFDSQERSLSGMKYVGEAFSKFSIVKTAHAQGYGFGAVSWIQKYWKGARDISYFILVLVIVVFSFMIMFKVKISPQAVISVQSALPKVFAALILATFSYAIAGFVIDLMYVVAGILASLLKTAGFSSSFDGPFAIMSGTGGINKLLGGFSIFLYMFAYVFFFFFSLIVNFVTTFLSFSVFGMIVSVVMVLVVAWLVILTLWYTIKVPFVLFKTLISIYVSIIIAPLQITAGALVPAIGFGQWLKKLFADVMVFPLTGLMIWLAYSTVASSFPAAVRGLFAFPASWGFDEAITLESWAPPLIGSAKNMNGIVLLFISFGLIIAIPKAADMLKAAIMGEKFAFGTAVSEALFPAKAYGMYAAKELELGEHPKPIGRLTGMIKTRSTRQAIGKTVGEILEGMR